MPHMRLRRSSEISTSGGLNETDMNAFAVIPCTWPPTRVVSTVTPVANMPSVLRKAIAGSLSGSPTSINSETGTSSKAESPSPASAPGENPPGSSISNSRGGGGSLLIRRLCRPARPCVRGPRRSRVLSSGDGSRGGCRRPLGHRRRLLAPVRPLVVLHDAAVEEEHDRDQEDGDTDDLLLRAAVAAGGDLHPAEPDDRQDQAPDREDAGDRNPDRRQLDRSRPVGPIPAQEHEPGQGEHVREQVPEVRRGQDAE